MADPLFQLTYRVRLTTSAVFASVSGDPNLIRSEGYVPGSAVWGALARMFITQNLDNVDTHAHADPDFRRLFLQESVRCLNAYPVLHDTYRTLPMPLSLRREKGDEKKDKTKDVQVFDFAFDQDTQDENVQKATEEMKASFCLLQGRTFESHSPRRHLMYHTTRGDNRKQGRANEETGGGVFVYEALDGGQTFEGRILGSEADLALIAILVAHSDEVWLGRSKATQYGGGAKLTLPDAQPQEFEREVSFDNAIAPNGATRLVLTLTAHLLAADPETGYPAREFPKADLAAALGINEDNLKPMRSYARRETVGGYVAKWRMPRPQWSAFAAGSVFIFDLEGATISADAIKNAETHSLGLRVGEGYGRFVINAHGTEKSPSLESSTNVILKPDTSPPDAFTDMVRKIVRDDMERRVRQKALDVANEFDKGFLPTTSLLGRLTLIVRDTLVSGDAKGFTNFADVILAEQPSKNGLKLLARRQLERCRRTPSENKVEALVDHLRAVVQNRALSQPGHGVKLAVPNEIREAAGYKDEKLADDLTRIYLLTLLAALSRLKRIRGEDNE